MSLDHLYGERRYCMANIDKTAITYAQLALPTSSSACHIRIITCIIDARAVLDALAICT